VEITDMLRGLDKIVEHDARYLGQQEMQMVVLKWAVGFRAALSPEMRESLIKAMKQRLADSKRERPAMPKPQEPEESMSPHANVSEAARQ
jgi:hypothetical protein